MSTSNNRKRDIRLVFYLTEDELQLLEEKMEAANIHNREAYLRKMALDGYVIRIDTEPIQRVSYLLSNATNNLNQLAKHANETRNIYGSDIQKLQAELPPLCAEISAAISSIANIRSPSQGKKD